MKCNKTCKSATYEGKTMKCGEQNGSLKWICGECDYSKEFEVGQKKATEELKKRSILL